MSRGACGGIYLKRGLRHIWRSYALCHGDAKRVQQNVPVYGHVMGLVCADERSRGNDTGCVLCRCPSIGSAEATGRKNQTSKEFLLCVLSGAYVDSAYDKTIFIT